MGSILELKTNLRSLRLGEGPGEEGRTPFVLATELNPDFNAPPPKTPNTLELAAERRQEDVSRLTQLLASGRGVTFLSKQALLSYTEDRKIGQALRNVAAQIPTLIGQAAASGTGLHLSADIITGNTYLPVNTSYLNRNVLIPDNKFINGEVVKGLSNEFRTGSFTSELDSYYSDVAKNRKVGSTDTPFINTDPETFSNTVTYLSSSFVNSSNNTLKVKKESSLNPSDTKIGNLSTSITRLGTNGQAVRQPLAGTDYSRGPEAVIRKRTAATKYATSGSAIVLKMSQAGVRGSAGKIAGTDQLNYLIYLGSNVPGNEEATKDLINFKIVVYEPGNKDNDYLYFRAYLDSFNDNFTGDWNATKYIGRAEPVYNYTGFNRGISFGFKLAASSEAELVPLYKKFNRLAGTTSPSYSNTFMRGVFVKLTVGDYLKDVSGFFTSVQATWQTNYPWESSLGKKNPGTPQLPHILDISVAFTPVHDFTPAYKQNFISDIENAALLVAT